MMLCCLRMYSSMSAVKSSPAMRMDLLLTMPPKAMTAISEVPPPMSMIMLPVGSSTSMPIPMAAAIGSWIRRTSLAPACSAESFTARSSTSVMPEGMQMTIFRLGGNRLFLKLIILIISRIMYSAAWKSAMTPSRSGRMVLMFSWVLPCIIMARLPTAMIFFESRCMATMEGSSTTTLSLYMIIVLAVPRSMAISLFRNDNTPIFVLFSR